MPRAVPCRRVATGGAPRGTPVHDRADRGCRFRCPARARAGRARPGSGATWEAAASGTPSGRLDLAPALTTQYSRSSRRCRPTRSRMRRPRDAAPLPLQASPSTPHETVPRTLARSIDGPAVARTQAPMTCRPLPSARRVSRFHYPVKPGFQAPSPGFLVRRVQLASCRSDITAEVSRIGGWPCWSACAAVRSADFARSGLE